jgi:hypothetical protein
LNVFNVLNTNELLDKYYLKRWRRDAKDGTNMVSQKGSQVTVEASIANRCGSLMRTYSNILIIASQSSQGYEYAQKMTDEFKHKGEELCKITTMRKKKSNDVNEMPESS